MNLITFALACTGMLALCLAMTRHYRDLFNTHPAPSRRASLRLFGSVLLAGCIAGNMATQGMAIGGVVAIGQIMLAGLVAGLGLAWKMARQPGAPR